MNKALTGAVAALVFAIAVGGAYWFGTQRAGSPAQAAASSGAPAASAAAKGGAPAPGSVTVEAVPVTIASLPQTITAVGSLRSDESVTLRPEVAGRISSIAFLEGQPVAKGAMLVRLDPAVPQAEAQQARANLVLARTKFDRAVDLAKSNFISGQAKDEAENNLKVAEASLQLAEAKLAKMDLRAPFSGVIGLRSVSVGDYVKEGADLVNLESIDPLKVDFRVPEVYMRQVKVGQPLQIQLDALPGKTFEGKVFAVNPLIDAAGRSVVIRAMVRNPDTSLRPGMFARVRLITRDAQNALVLPEQALVPQGDQQFVYRIVDGKAVRTKVDVGQRRDAKVEILSGVAKDDLVVTAGQLKLRDGAPVSVAAGTPAAPVASAPGMAPADASPAKVENATAPAPKS
ncbi:MAG TPA: efflux RND transporter periplasmic adaptor subunit [Casimicrobiaceae bacterium]|nr:efflux RND transporter periplasmic adaptor subunit [Casimicrobiaceae bacterium]